MRLIDADKITYTPSVPIAVISQIVNAGREEDAKHLFHVSRADIDAQPTIDAVPQWIPCSERLPEVRQWVLCQCRAGIMDVLRLTADGSWNKNYPNTEYMGGFVVAWMPLPKPYEGDKE